MNPASCVLSVLQNSYLFICQKLLSLISEQHTTHNIMCSKRLCSASNQSCVPFIEWGKSWIILLDAGTLLLGIYFYFLDHRKICCPQGWRSGSYLLPSWHNIYFNWFFCFLVREGLPHNLFLSFEIRSPSRTNVCYLIISVILSRLNAWLDGSHCQ